MNQKENWLGPYIPQGNFFRELVQQAKLAYNLIMDPRVHPVTKLIPLAALGYILLPIDIAPDVIPLLGQLDDAAVLVFGLRMFFEFAPPGVVEEHLKRLVEKVGKGDWTVVDPGTAGTSGSAPAGGEVVDEG
jgi:uncharacterized membrane protein YkvA (DUF1232 family)